MTPSLYSLLRPPQQEFYFNELAVVTSVGLYSKKNLQVSVSSEQDLEAPASRKLLPSSMFLSANRSSQLCVEFLDDGKSQVCLSFAHLFYLCWAVPPINTSTPWAMRVERTRDGRVLFKEVNIPHFGDRGAAFLSLYLPNLLDSLIQESISSASTSTLSLPSQTITLYSRVVPVALFIPNSPFSESLTALTAVLSPGRQVTVGRLDPMTGSVHQVQPITLNVDKSVAVSTVSTLFSRLLSLVEGEYILVHRKGADNVIVVKERESEDEVVFDMSSFFGSSDNNYGIDQINKD
jgi:hypothetical protein